MCGKPKLVAVVRWEPPPTRVSCKCLASWGLVSLKKLRMGRKIGVNAAGITGMVGRMANRYTCTVRIVIVTINIHYDNAEG